MCLFFYLLTWGLAMRNLHGYQLAGIRLADLGDGSTIRNSKKLSRTQRTLFCTVGNDDSLTEIKTG